MEGLIRRPGPVNLRTGNVDAAWQHFKQKFEIFLIAIGKQNAEPAVKWSLLMLEAGDHALEVYNSLKGTLTRTTPGINGAAPTITDESQDYDRVVREFDLYAKENKSLTACRQLFNSRNQKPQEQFSNWLTALKNLIKPCEYGDLSDSLLKDRIVLGAQDKRLRETLRCKPNLSLQEVIEVCKALETTEKNSPETGEEASVDSIKFAKGQNRFSQKRGNKKQRRGANRGQPKKRHHNETNHGYQSHQKKPYQRGSQNNYRNSSQRGRMHQNSSENKYQCLKCDRWHGPRNCPAYKQECSNCGQLNHWEVVCTNAPKSKNPPSRKVNTVQVVKENATKSDLILDSWDSLEIPEKDILLDNQVHMIATVEDDELVDSRQGKRPRKEYAETLRLGGKHYIRFKLDPGSEANIIPLKVFLIINKNNEYEIRSSKILIKSYGKNISPVEGIVTLLVETKYGDSQEFDFLLSSVEDRPLLGIEACEALNLVKRVERTPVSVEVSVVQTTDMPTDKQEFLEKFNDIFSGLGQFKQTVKITVDPKIPFGMSPPRRYNFSIAERLKSKLETLEHQGIVAKVTNEIPKFVSNLVIREKPNGDLRICLDPDLLNKAIIRHKYPIPAFDELSSKVRDKKIFSVLDLKDGFWHANLDEESSLLCSFSTPYGIYRFKKLPFGVSCAPEMFQFLNEQVFSETGALIYFDDLLIAGKDYAEHDLILTKVMNKARKETIRFNPVKLQYRKLMVMFLGLLWSLNSIKIDPERIAAIQALKEPRTKKQLQKTIGVFNHLRKFIPNMGSIAAPLCNLLSDSVSYQWLPIHAEAFQKLKDCICQAQALTPYDRSKPIIVQADASQFGLGAVLLQQKRPVASASRKLTETEQNYAQIEKEMLALCFAAIKFEKFIYGMKDVIFQTDHQPLVSIFKKPVFKITNNRLKKMRLKLMMFQPNVQYLAGKYMYLSDLLSREYLEDPVQDDPEMVEVVHEVTTHLSISSEIKEDLVKETAKDAGLQAVMNYYQHGWPLNRQKILVEAMPYWKLRNDLFAEEGLVILEDKVVVPVTLRAKVLKLLHSAHMGIEKTKARARQVVYWPGITNDITTLVQECRVCERHSSTNFHEPLIPHEIPTLPYQKVSCDILTHESQPYLVVEDNLSKWLEIHKLTSKSSTSVINVFRNIFSTHGIPEEIFGDNNPLNSHECREYAKSIGSSINTSSPTYSRSNGLGEKGVGIARKLLDKCADDGIHYKDALREYNNTPLSGMIFSPAQILMSRMCRTVVPTLTTKLVPKVVNVQPLLKKIQEKVKLQHDSHARRKPVTFEPGENIVFQRNKKWYKGVVVRKHTAHRSYIIRQQTGRELRRNTYHLKKSYTKPDNHDEDSLPYDIEGILVGSQVMNPEGNINEAPAPENQPEELAPNMEIQEFPMYHPQRGGRGRPRGSRNLHGVQNPGRVTRAGRQTKLPSKYC